MQDATITALAADPSEPWVLIALAVLAGMVVGSVVGKFIAKRITASWATEQATVLLLSAIAGAAITFGLGLIDADWSWYEAALWGAIGGGASGWLYPMVKNLVTRKSKEV